MIYSILLFILSFFILLIIVLTYQINFIKKDKADEMLEKTEAVQEKLGLLKGWLYAALVLVIILSLFVLYIKLKGSIWEGHLMEWLNIIVRLMHITFGIAWIGASFYFVFLENALNRTEDVREELAGNLWAVHGGGFYYLEKYKVAPKKLPKHLHWFKYEAYFTWLSGFCLLCVVYYFNAKAMLLDSSMPNLSTGLAISIGIGSFVLAWVLYDLFCKSALTKRPYLFIFIGILLLALFAFGYTHVFSARAAFIHFGAMLGSLMAGNVFFVIIPAQKKMVHAAKTGQPVDASPGKNALVRSIHNNYFTLPVLFVMVSNHFPSTFGNKYPWLILLIISLGVAGVKHWLNLREKGEINGVGFTCFHTYIISSLLYFSSTKTRPMQW